ncbi:MAG: hypothetical protein ACEPOW_03280 [Bacteroidales bacterium]
MKHLIKIALAIIVVGLAYFVYRSIQHPIEFKRDKKQIESQVIQRLKDIRTAEGLYKSINGKYTGNFDTLINFLNTGMIPVVNIVPDPTDTTFMRKIRDTVAFIKAADSVFSRRANVNASDIRFIPNSGNEQFELYAGTVKRSGVRLNVFEAKAPFSSYLNGLDEQDIINITAREEQIEKFPGMKVGSRTEPSTDGNWE